MRACNSALIDEAPRTASPLGGQISKPITGTTVYTLSCVDLAGATQTKTAKVRILPGFREL